MIECPTCQSIEFTGALFCGQCGGSFLEPNGPFEGMQSALPGVRARTKVLFPSLIGQKLGGRPDLQQVRLVVEGNGQELVFGLERPVLVGRADPTIHCCPEIDLSAAGGAENGVSRRHALIEMSDSGVMLTDLGSANGTALNDFALPADLPYALQGGDKIHFGDLLVQVYLE